MGKMANTVRANVDQALIVCAVRDPEFHPNLLDRFLILMARQNVPVLVCFNKTDLAEDGGVPLRETSLTVRRNVQEEDGVASEGTLVNVEDVVGAAHPLVLVVAEEPSRTDRDVGLRGQVMQVKGLGM